MDGMKQWYCAYEICVQTYIYKCECREAYEEAAAGAA